MKTVRLLWLLVLLSSQALADVSIRETIILTDEEQSNLRQLIQYNKEAQTLWNQIKQDALDTYELAYFFDKK